MKAVVMAGGEGSRLRPLTANRPKPMVPVCNRPIMEHIVRLLKSHGIEDVVATLYYQADEIQNYFGNGADFGVRMEYSIERTPLGTAGSVKKAQHLLRDGTFVIVSGDALTDCDLTRAIEFHRSKGSQATLILYRVETPLEFGLVVTDDDGRVVRLLEKPGWSQVISDTVNTGMYILEPSILDMIEENESSDWSADVFPKLIEQGAPVYGFVMDEYWTDVGGLQQYREAQADMLSAKVGLCIQDSPLGTEVSIGTNCVIDDTANLIPPICLGRGCKIKRGATIGPFTVLGDNTIVEQGAIVERSVVWDGAYIGANVGVHSGIIGSRAIIKTDSVIREDSVVGDRTLIDVGCTVRPRVKIWPDKTVERGSIVTMSLVWGSRWRVSLFRELGVAGLSNLEITPDFACRLGAAYGSAFPQGSSIVTSRDSTRSSRMIKRSLIASLLSAGCNVIDLRSSALPVTRHYVKTSGALGAVNVRKLPGNARVTLIEMFDSRGAYLSNKLERRVENSFFREDYPRADPDDLGSIEFASRAVDEYQHDYFRLLPPAAEGKPLRIVCDYGYSSLATMFPAMLARMGIESIALNGFNDAKLSPRTEQQMESHVRNLAKIVGTLGYDMGVLFTQEGEQLTVVDGSGTQIVGNQLLATLGMLLAKTEPGAKVAISVTAPTSLEEALLAAGANVIRTKNDVRSLMSTSLEEGVRFAGDDRGCFIYPEFHPGFDAAFSLGMLATMLQRSELSIREVASEVPVFRLAKDQVRVPWESKGTVMRRIAEENQSRVELLDGIKIFDRDSWVLILPDALEPIFHIYAESPEEDASRAMAREFVSRIERMLA